MKKYLFKIVALSGMLSYGVAHSQVANLPNHENDQKVYVSKNGEAYQAPDRTLDVGGAVKLETPGEPVNGSVPLAIANDGQVVIQNLRAETASFATKRYFVRVKEASGETKVSSEVVILNDLGIEYNKYIPILLNYKLMRLKTNNTLATDMKNLEVPPIVIQTLAKGVGGSSSPDELRVTPVAVTQGRARAILGGRDLPPTTGSSYNATHRRDIEKVFQAIPRVMIRNIGGNYAFTADWRDSGDALFTADNYWVMDVLLINKNSLSGNDSEVIKKAVVRPNPNGGTDLGNTWQLTDY